MDPTRIGHAETPPKPDSACAISETNGVSAANPLDHQPQPGPVLAYEKNPERQRPSRLRLWGRRLWAFIFILCCMDLGLALIVLPWKTAWINNPLLLRFPELRPVITSYFFRGMLTGLGLLDLWIGVWEAVHYSDKG